MQWITVEEWKTGREVSINIDHIVAVHGGANSANCVISMTTAYWDVPMTRYDVMRLIAQATMYGEAHWQHLGDKNGEHKKHQAKGGKS
jgi:hypothetical protein